MGENELKAGKTGLLLIFIGMIIPIFFIPGLILTTISPYVPTITMGLFIPGVIVTLVGTVFASDVNKVFRKARNFYIVYLVLAAIALIIRLIMYVVVNGLYSSAMLTEGYGIIFSTVFVGLIISMMVIQYKAEKNIILGCKMFYEEINQDEMAYKCATLKRNFLASTLVLIFGSIAAFILFIIFLGMRYNGIFIPLYLPIIIFLVAIAYYLTIKILIIIRVYKTRQCMSIAVDSNI